MIKKTIIGTMLASSLLADGMNVATMTDLKESIAYLIDKQIELTQRTESLELSSSESKDFQTDATSSLDRLNTDIKTIVNGNGGGCFACEDDAETNLIISDFVKNNSVVKAIQNKQNIVAAQGDDSSEEQSLK